MKDQPIDTNSASLLLDALRKELSVDPRGQELLSRFLKSPRKHGQELTDYLYRRLSTDAEFKERLAGSQNLPLDMRAIVSGGRVDKIIQIAEAGMVTIHQGIPVWVGLSAVIITVIAVGAMVFTLIPKPAPIMGNGFNIAVAEFAMVDAGGHVSSSDVSSQFSDGLFQTIGNEIKRLPAALAVELRGPADVGVVVDDLNAAKTAERINATILIYGLVRRDDRGLYEVEPHFYISDKATSNYGSEVTGPDYLGKPIPGLTLDPNGQFEFNTTLNARVQALQNVIRGLAYFYVGDYDSAANEFQDAVKTPHWDAQDGQEVGYLLLGAAQLRAWDLIQNPEVLPSAFAAFTKAHELAPDYARSYLGLGAAALAEAQELNADGTGIGRIDQEKLNEAINWYSAGLDVNQPPKAYVPTKSAFGLGQAYLLGYEFQALENSKEMAQKYYQAVINKYQTENEISDLGWFAAHAHAGLGRLAALDNNWATMSEEYLMAVTILERIQPNPPNIWIARFWSYAGFAEEKQNHIAQARNYYDRAITTGSGVVGETELKGWKETLNRLK